jgi:hypothetical protein
MVRRITIGLAAALAVGSVVGPSTAEAQRLGIVGGGTFSQLRGLDDVRTETRTGTMFGVSLAVPLGDRWTFQPEGLFINKGSKFPLGGGGRRDIRLDYLEVPLLVRREIGESGVLRPHLYAGPSVSVNVGCDITLTGGGIPNSSSNCGRDNFDPETFDWGAVLGTGVDLHVGGLGVTGGMRYGFGLANVSKDTDDQFIDRVRNGTLTIYAGLLFGKR